MNQLAEKFKNSVTELGLFYPKHYILAVFRDLGAAEAVRNKLRDAGFSDEDAFEIPGPELIRMENDETGFGGLLMHVLSRLFATEQITTDQDIARARDGAAFVAAYCPREGSKEDAVRIIAAESPLAARYYGVAGIEHLAGDLVTN